ncbi:MAG: hypothetical protein HC822_09495 [Oscillochloris sp.]|nr:hypothetical protein [Oscillochloris sp.]
MHTATGAPPIACATTNSCRATGRRGSAWRRSIRPDGLGRRFQKRLARINAAPWQLATGQDLRWEAAAGAQRVDPVSRLAQGYFDRVLLAITPSSLVAARFSAMQNMLRSPAVLFHPTIVREVLRCKVTPPQHHSNIQPPIAAS